MGAQRKQCGKPQHAGPHLRFSGCAGRRSARLSLLPRIQIIPARRLKCPLIRLFSLGFPPGLLFMRFFSLQGNPRFFALFALLFYDLFCSSLLSTAALHTHLYLFWEAHCATNTIFLADTKYTIFSKQVLLFCSFFNFRRIATVPFCLRKSIWVFHSI